MNLTHSNRNTMFIMGEKYIQNLAVREELTEEMLADLSPKDEQESLRKRKNMPEMQKTTEQRLSIKNMPCPGNS